MWLPVRRHLHATQAVRSQLLHMDALLCTLRVNDPTGHIGFSLPPIQGQVSPASVQQYGQLSILKSQTAKCAVCKTQRHMYLANFPANQKEEEFRRFAPAGCRLSERKKNHSPGKRTWSLELVSTYSPVHFGIANWTQSNTSIPRFDTQCMFCSLA